MITAEDRIVDAGYEDVMIFQNPAYDSALVGVSDDNRAIYDFDMMVEWLEKNDGMTQDEAIEWIEYNTIRALPYYKENAPIILYRV